MPFKGALVAAAAALMTVVAAPADAAILPPGQAPYQATPTVGPDPFYMLDFTDSHGDVGQLKLQLGSPLGAGGTTVLSISGTLNGLAASAAHVFGADQLLYGSTPNVDYSGIGFTNTGGDNLNLYYTNPSRANNTGQLGICFESSCNSSSGFYTLSSFSLTAIPEPASWLLLMIGVGALGATLRLRRTEPKFA